MHIMQGLTLKPLTEVINVLNESELVERGSYVYMRRHPHVPFRMRLRCHCQKIIYMMDLNLTLLIYIYKEEAVYN